jgi:5'-nucleotidase (lipoprotein e(P4) family)
MKSQNYKPVRLLLLSLTLLFGQSLSAFGQTPGEQGGADNTYIEGATLWQQASGERRALSYQAYTLARMMLNRDLRLTRRSRKPRAIIVDVDETILDNSPFEGFQLKHRVNYNQKDWSEWISRARAEAVPGAVAFLRYAASHGVRVFYITNRRENHRPGTMANLTNLGFPNVSDETLLVQTDLSSSSKEGRRQGVGAKYRIVLLIGDDLNDFSDVFENAKTIEGRKEMADRYKEEFGRRFIMLPNAMYGNWETSVNGNAKTEAEKAEKRRNLIKDF